MHHHIIVVFVLAGMAFAATYSPERRHPPGQQIAPRAPLQTEVGSAAPVVIDEYTLRPRARLQLEARVLARERYRFDRVSGLIPIDIAFGWAEMSDTALIDKLSMHQRGRFLIWNHSGPPPAPYDIINGTSANTHLIPASKAVQTTLFNARVGDVVILEGDLVDVEKGTYLSMATSLTRDDSGPGACEIIYVRSASIRP